jgi:hypothetical protein
MEKYSPKPGEVKAYLEGKNIEYKERGNELMFACLNGCDDDDTESEKYHCSVNAETGLWHCFKCDQKGNFTQLKQLLGDSITQDKSSSKKPQTMPKKLITLAARCHQELMKPENRELLNYLLQERGISLLNVNYKLLGCGEFYGKKWLTIPIIEDKDCKLIKLRCLPDDSSGAKYSTYPSGAGSTVFGITELQRSNSSSVLICGGEFDRIIAEQMKFGMPVITGTAGEGTFKDEWIKDYLDGRDKIYICLDNDEKGKNSTKMLADKIVKLLQNVSVYAVPIPEELGNKADLTDANKAKYTAKQLLAKAELIAGDEPVAAENFKEVSLVDLQNILSLTIKFDNINKVIVFLAMLSAYTEENQLNIFLNARSSSGKTYIVTEVASLFPKMDVRKYMRVSPTAFYYDDQAMTQDDSGEMVLDLSRRILVFMDQVDTKLQAMIRPLLSHDDKKIAFKLTNRNNSGKNAAVNGYILGYPATIFCSANMQMDEQEQTRAILLSPEITQEKINAGIDLYQQRANDNGEFQNMLASNSDRKLLIQRIRFIRELNIRYIIVPKELEVGKTFKNTLKGNLLPRHQRDSQHFNSFVKVCALLNAPKREIRDHDLVATKADVDAALEIWNFLGRSQQYGIPPQMLDFYDNMIVPAYIAKRNSAKATAGITIDDLAAYCYGKTGEMLNRDQVRKQYLPVLEQANLISYEKDPNDKRKMVIAPLVGQLNVNNSQKGEENE